MVLAGSVLPQGYILTQCIFLGKAPLLCIEMQDPKSRKQNVEKHKPRNKDFRILLSISLHFTSIKHEHFHKPCLILVLWEATLCKVHTLSRNCVKKIYSSTCKFLPTGKKKNNEQYNTQCSNAAIKRINTKMFCQLNSNISPWILYET